MIIRITLAANTYCTIETALCKVEIRVDLDFMALLLEFMNLIKMVCPSMYATQIKINKAIPADDVLNSTIKSATI